MNIKTGLAFALLSWSLIAAPNEFETERERLLVELLEAQGINYLGESYAENLALGFDSFVSGNGVKPDSELLSLLMQVSSEAIYEELVYSGELQRYTAQAYEDLTVSELRELVNFYQSEVGQKILVAARKFTELELAKLAEIEQVVAKKVEARMIEYFDGDGAQRKNFLEELEAQKKPSKTEEEMAKLVSLKCSDVENSVKPLPVYRAPPAYPRVAASYQVEGWVELAFTVDGGGSTSDVRVTNSSTGTMFNEAAINAVENYRYCPGKPAEGQTIRIRFEMEGKKERLSRADPAVKRLAEAKGHELRFVATQSFLRNLNLYAAKQSRKALALAYDGVDWSNYIAWGYRTELEASDAALRECEKARKRKGIKNECQLFMTGSMLGSKFRDQEVIAEIVARLHHRGFEERSNYEITIANYRDLLEEKALAISEKPNGGYYLHHSEGLDTQKEANDLAVSKCNEEKPEEFVNDCRLHMIGDEFVGSGN